MTEQADYRVTINEHSDRLVSLLVSCDTIVPWFGSVKHILDVSDAVFMKYSIQIVKK